MLKMIDVLDKSIVQNFSQVILQDSDLISEQLHHSILKTPEQDLQHVFTQFFTEYDLDETANALELSVERIHEMKSGIALKDQEKISDTLKLVTLCLAVETNTLDQIEVAECLQDYPM